MSPLPVRSSPVAQNMRANGLWAFESRHHPTFAMPLTRHRFLKLLWIREGAGCIDFVDSRHACELGDLVFIPASVQHRIIDSPGTPLALYGLGIDSEKLDCVKPVLEYFAAGIYRASHAPTLRIEQRIRKIVYLNDQLDPSGQLASIATTLDLLAELALSLRPPKRKATRLEAFANKIRDDPLIESYIQWLNRNFYEPLTLDGAATACGISRRTFTNRFKSWTGMSWLEYLNVLRIQHAVTLLKQTNRNVTSIAFQCGFEDLTTFYRAFKRIRGESPQTCRQGECYSLP